MARTTEIIEMYCEENAHTFTLKKQKKIVQKAGAVANKAPRNKDPKGKIVLKKYNPILRKYVIYKERKVKK